MKWLLVLSLAACSGKSSEHAKPEEPLPPAQHLTTAPGCDALMDRLFELQLATAHIDRNDEAQVAGFRAGSRTAFAKQREDCESSPWSSTFRLCIANITPTHDRATLDTALDACRRDSLVAKGVDLGGPACEDLVAHFLALGVPAAQVSADVRARMLHQCSMMPRATKECAMRAADKDALAACDQ